ncbi:unnamed protein product [marine sediment metagenome]|uniref:Uncharacterized protein n=1 Tax=marine sediment metagenome TaxID=412755 RepID=X1H1Y5_9ZZZZ
MQITQALVGNVLYPLAEGQPLPIVAGDVIKVFYVFSYKVPEKTDVRIWASLYDAPLGWLNRKEAAQTKETITLEMTPEWKPYEGEIDIAIGSIGSGIYGLIVELPDYDTEARIDACLEVAAVPGIFDMLVPLLVLGLMVFLIPKLKEGFG